MRLPFHSSAPQRAFRRPSPSPIPELKKAQVAARYHEARLGGDFFEFLPIAGGRLILLLLDIAGKRDSAMDIAAAVQDVLRPRAQELLNDPAVNENNAVTELLLELNRTVLAAAGGVHCAPAFLACYDEELGMLVYVNAGHVPALIKDSTGISPLPATGLPLGLFSHALHEAQNCVLEPGATLLLASRGVFETRGSHPREEFGLKRVQQSLAETNHNGALEVCTGVLSAVRAFAESAPKMHFPGLHRNGKAEEHDPLDSAPNDATVLALVRTS